MTGDRMLGRVMLAFEGERLPRWVERRLAAAPVAGMTLFIANNVRRADQVRELTDAFQRAGLAGRAERSEAQTGPLLVAADQEGGQLNALGAEATQFAGNMALGAVGDVALTERVGAAIGREARAMGVNVVFAPVLDLATEPHNTALGIRSFGDDPAEVARHGAAMVRGLQSAGVAAGVKHFPGLGAVDQDTHYDLGVVRGSREQLEENALVPFRAAIVAGARVAMSAHVAVPALSGDPTLPATLSRAVMQDMLRDRLGFGGITISDALDMRALAQGPAQAVEVIAAVRAGIDLLLCAADRPAQRRIEMTLRAAEARGLFERGELEASSARLADLRSWLAAAGPPPDLDVVGSAEHLAISRELAERSLTRFDRGPDGGEPAPLVLAPGTRILAIMPEPADLTPADTSSYVAPGLGRALRTRFDSVDDV
ncbi:MAG: beta-N-acetylhexosaminidase, partial [Chloroflexota bacterium]|nr:beta-N-acetylhexosaminidase [Chloroflexota bacterium]